MTLDELEVCPFCGREKVEWISVKDRLPKFVEEYLSFYETIPVLATNGSEVLTGKFSVSKDDGDLSFHEECYDFIVTYYQDMFEHKDITHWMYLPEPPKGE